MRCFVFATLICLFSTTLNAGGSNLPASKSVYFTILAGGGGTRLWPLSRDHEPKQFLKLGQYSLVEQSVLRLESYPSFAQTHIVIATAANLSKPMHSQIAGLHLRNPTMITSDPSRRDTGPAILLNVLKVLEQDPDATIAFLPADPYIPNAQNEEFVAALQQAISVVENNPNKIVLLGKMPTFPATGFGYIETGSQANDGVLSVASFKEKPDLRLAQEFLATKKYLWNMGIFVGKARFFGQLFEQYAQEISGPVSQYLKSGAVTDYNNAKSVSVDIAVMQPASRDQHLLVIPVSFDWDDVGDVKTYMEIQNNYLASIGRAAIKYEHAPDAHDNLVFADSKKLVSIVGLSGVCVVDTQDALLIIPCDQAQKVKNVVEALKSDRTLTRFVE